VGEVFSPHKSNPGEGNFTMKGDLYAWSVCKCGGTWNRIEDPVTKKALNYLCATCGMPPEKFGVDARSFRNRRGELKDYRLTRGKDGEYLYSVHQARRLLELLRAKWDEVGRERFDITEFSKRGRENYKLSECARKWQLYVEQRVELKERSRSYASGIERKFRLHVIPFLGADLDIREITPADVERLQTALREKLSRNSATSCLIALNTLLRRYAYREGAMPKPPIFPEEWSTFSHPTWREVTVAEQRSLMAKMVWAAKKRVRRTLLLLLKVYTFLGCRPGEACGLKKKHLLEDGKVKIEGSIEAATGALRPTKTGRSRIAPEPLPAGLLAQLRALPVLPEAYLFTRNGRAINPGWLSRLFRQVNQLEGVTLYVMAKHSLATRTADEVVRESKRVAARRVGVSDAVLDNHYLIRG
jgi:integrase